MPDPSAADHGQAARLRDAVVTALGSRRLVYLGIRGGDAAALRAVPQLAYVLTLSDSVAHGSAVQARSVEDMTGRRIDLDGDVDLGVRGRRWLLDSVAVALSAPSALVPYRPNTDIDLSVLSATAPCTYLGGSARQQVLLEQKGWVDDAMADLGLATLGWRTVGALDTSAIDDLLLSGPAVARLDVSSGGAGLARVESLEDVARFARMHGVRTVAMSTYVDAVPINVAGVVWPDAVTVHPVSLQLIGVPALTERVFGYCGNDFAAAKGLPALTLADIERQVRLIGGWLRDLGYLGAFGVDMLTDGERVWFCEINARFQGSTRSSDRISSALDRSGLVLEHLASHLGLAAPADGPDLVEMVASAPATAHAILHHAGHIAQRLELGAALGALVAAGASAEVVCPPEVTCAPKGVVFRAVFDHQITVDGRTLIPANALAEASELVAGGAVSS